MRSWSDIDLFVQPFEPTFCILTLHGLFLRMNDLTAPPHGLLSKLEPLSEGQYGGGVCGGFKVRERRRIICEDRRWAYKAIETGPKEEGIPGLR
jgi:hypothetical protein